VPERKRYTMNRNAKGAIAVGAATLLLLGGGGTFALWNDSVSTGASEVVSGQLYLSDPSSGKWYSDDDFIPANDITADVVSGDYNIVPGTTVYFVGEDITVTADGSNLYYAFVAGLSDAAIADNLDDYFTVSATFEEAVPSADAFFPGAAAPAGTYTSTTPAVNLTAPTDAVWLYNSGDATTGDAFDVILAITFNADNIDAQDETLNLTTDIVFALVQVIKP